MEEKKIILGHGSGGVLSRRLLTEIISPLLGSGDEFGLMDSAIIEIEQGKTAFTTDSYIIDPIFFPGGDIGTLAVSGTVNDLLMVGAAAKYISLSLMIEEGFEIDNLKRILKSIKHTVDQCGVKIATGDTKILPKGKGDGIFINTAGVGELIVSEPLTPGNISIGDSIILTGTLGDHSAAVMIAREGLAVKSEIESDCAPLTEPLTDLLRNCQGVKYMRDPTRGGLAGVLNEISADINAEIYIDESEIPVRKDVSAVCEILGIDPLFMANEGKAVIFIKKSDTGKAINILSKYKISEIASIIGKVKSSYKKGRVVLKTGIGGERLIHMPMTEQLPRIC